MYKIKEYDCKVNIDLMVVENVVEALEVGKTIGALILLKNKEIDPSYYNEIVVMSCGTQVDLEFSWDDVKNRYKIEANLVG